MKSNFFQGTGKFLDTSGLDFERVETGGIYCNRAWSLSIPAEGSKEMQYLFFFFSSLVRKRIPFLSFCQAQVFLHLVSLFFVDFSCKDIEFKLSSS